MVLFLVKGAVLTALVCLIISPKFVFSWLDQYLFAEEPTSTTVAYMDTTRSTQMDSPNLDLEESRLANIQKMIDSAKTADIRRIWELKKAEFLRNSRWSRLVEFAGATERISTMT